MTTRKEYDLTRRQFLAASAGGAVSMGMASWGANAYASETPVRKPNQAQSPGEGPYNILFILTDQERYIDPAEYPPGYALPGRERLQQRGVTFTKHQINSAVCTSSRSVIYTGQHIQHTKLFDNMGLPWTKHLRMEVPTLGDLLGEVGYYAAYKGKWHLSPELGTQDEYALPQEKLTEVIESYGFRDYVGIGDVIGHILGGYLNDEMIGAQARRWLRLGGQSMAQQGKPWFLAVNLVNPHDVMFYNTDAPGQHIQDVPKPLMGIAREPDVPLYRQQWRVQLPKTRHESFDKPGRPAAHKEYQMARAALVGSFPNEDARWRRLLNYYFNCILQTDRVVEGILNELDALGLTDNTIVVMTADHGELGGSHGTHGKGSTTYKEQNHVPLIISHPGYRYTHGQRCDALTSHIDLAPTLIAWAGGDAKRRGHITRDLCGHNLTPLLAKGAAARLNEIRSASLYCYNMLLYLDSGLTRKIQAYLNAGGDKNKIADQGFKPDFTKRAAIRSLFDGRYKYSRYFSPKQHNQPRTLKGIFELNDVELFDLSADPDEIRNLATEPKRNGDLLLAMNKKMNALIEAEVGVPDDGSFLPGEHADWAATKFDP
jgi:arylsulfatase